MRPSAERRRDALLRAAMEIVAESGTTAATHRAIASRAGLPLATTSYFFSSIDELLEEATRRFTSDRASELDAVSRAIPDRASYDDTAALFAEVLLTGDRMVELAQIEAYLHAARSSHLREAVAEAMSAFERAAETALAAAGAQRPRAGARAFMAMVDGFVLEHLARPDEYDRIVFQEALRSLFIAYAMDDAERADWDRRLAREPARHDAR